MDVLTADNPGEIITGSLRSNGQSSPPVTISDSLANLANDIVTNFGPHDLIDIGDLSVGLDNILYSGSQTGGELTFSTEAGRTAPRITGNVLSGNIHATSDKHGGTMISFS